MLRWVLVVGIGLLAGCASTPVVAPQQRDVVIVAPGVGGDGPDYAKVVQALQQAGSPDCLRVMNWGYGWLLFPVNIADTSLHHRAEAQLAEDVRAWRQGHPGCRVALIGHSAGAGVVLGMLGELDGDERIGPVILLAPAVSPGYDLRPALRHATAIHVFYSPRDTFWLGFGSSVFGTYDHHFLASAAGRAGFNYFNLDADERARLIEHEYEPAWKSLGNDGGHFDWLATKFVESVIEPLVDPPASAAARP